jgi:serine/threonine protein kinase
METSRRYFLGKHELGASSLSRVLEGHDRLTGECVAVKVTPRCGLSEEDARATLNEVAVLRQLVTQPHRHVVRYRDHYEDAANYYLVLELLGRTLLDEVRSRGAGARLPVVLALRYFRQLLCAVEHLHQRLWAHRDLKLENVLLDHNGEVRLIDFGFATSCAEPLHTYCFSPQYEAPEILRKVPYDGRPADVWSLGVVLYVLLTSEMPFAEAQLRRFARDRKRRPLPYHSALSPPLSSLLERMFDLNPLRRPTISTLLHAAPLLAGPLYSEEEEDEEEPSGEECYSSDEWYAHQQQPVHQQQPQSSSTATSSSSFLPRYPS